jgi:tetratricopeptide (TPR) repeat protein
MWLLLAALLVQSADFEAEGIKALEAQHYEAAIDLLGKAVAAAPQDYTAQFQLALAYSLLGNDAEAIPHYRTALDLKPGLYEAELNLGLSLLRSKDAAAAIPFLKNAADQRPTEIRPVATLAQALLAARQFREAETAYNTVLGLNPKSAVAEIGLGEALAQQGRRAEAELHFRKAAALDPKYKDALLELAALYEADHQPAEAIAIYRDYPDNPAAQERMGALLLESGRASEAIAPLEASVAKSPTAANRLTLAQAYVKTQQSEKATPLMAAVVQAQPRDVPLRLFYARLLRDQRKFTDAAAQFMTAAQLQPDLAETWSELAGVFIGAEQYPQALAALDRVRSLGAEKTGHYYFRAVILDHLHQPKDALENYNKFLDSSQGTSPDEEFIARQRVRILKNELGKR